MAVLEGVDTFAKRTLAQEDIGNQLKTVSITYLVAGSESVL